MRISDWSSDVCSSDLLVSQLPGIRDAGDARLCVAARVSATTTFRGADRKFILLFMVMLTIAAGNTALQSVLPALGRSLGVADNNVAAAFSASALLWVIAAPFWAKRSDRHGRRAMILMGLGGFAVSLLICGVFLAVGINGWIRDRKSTRLNSS